jgi:hypothetical protein
MAGCGEGARGQRVLKWGFPRRLEFPKLTGAARIRGATQAWREERTMAKGSGGGARARARARHRRRDALFLSPVFARSLAMVAAGPAQRTAEGKQSRFLSKAAKGSRDA